jgi:hypothetical protein
MPCGITCSISAVFIIGMIYMNYSMLNSQIMQKYERQLPENLQYIYREIVNERTKIYYFGYFLGFILSIVVILYNTKLGKNKMSNYGIVCTVVTVSSFVNYFYYILSPKNNWMLREIKTEEQTKAWLEMYRHMQMYYHSGFVLGIIAVGIFAFAFC